MVDEIEDDGAPGWDAIDAALKAVYPTQAPQHYGPVLRSLLGGEDPLDGISVYWNDAPLPHWHFVTYGFSELYEKESDDPATSGYGFELSFRVAAAAGSEPPAWAMNFLQNLARYVFANGKVFQQGHYLNAGGPIAADTDTLLRHVAFMRDPQLPARETPNGSLEFLQVIGLTDDEMEAVKRWSTTGVLETLLPRMPLWITDIARGSLLGDPALAAAVAEGAAREGSQTAYLFLEKLAWSVQGEGAGQQLTLTLGARQVESLLALLPARLLFGQPLTLVGNDRQITLSPAAVNALVVDADALDCQLAPATVQALVATVMPRRGTYAIPGWPALQVVVEPSELRDAEGTVVRTIG